MSSLYSEVLASGFDVGRHVSPLPISQRRRSSSGFGFDMPCSREMIPRTRAEDASQDESQPELKKQRVCDDALSYLHGYGSGQDSEEDMDEADDDYWDWFRNSEKALINYYKNLDPDTTAVLIGTSTEDPYNVLNVEADASAKQVRRAYRRLAVQHHPDKGGDTQVFQQITQAHALLSDPARRSAYDASVSSTGDSPDNAIDMSDDQDQQEQAADQNDQNVGASDQSQESAGATISRLGENEDMAFSVNLSELGAILQRHAAKGKPGKQFNLAGKTTEPQRVGEIENHFRRVHGHKPPQGDLGDFRWLTLENLQRENKAVDLKDMFPDQQSVSTKGVCMETTRNKALSNIDAVLQALIKYVKNRSDLDEGTKERYIDDYEEQREELEPLIDELKEKEKIRKESGELRDEEKAKFGDLNYENDLLKPLVDEVNDHVVPLLQRRGKLDSKDLQEVQYKIHAACEILIPPPRAGVLHEMAFITEDQDTQEYLSKHEVYNYIVMKEDGGVQLVVRKTKNDKRSMNEGYDPKIDAPDLNDPPMLRLDLLKSKASARSREILDVFERFGLNPGALARLLLAYNKYLQRKHPRHNPRYLFASLENKPRAASTLREHLKAVVEDLTERPEIHSMNVRTWYRNYIDGKRISIADNRVIANHMMHTLETAIGVYQKTNTQVE